MPTLPYLTDTSTQLSGIYTTSTATLDNFATSNYVSSNYLPLKGAVLNDRINLIIPTAATCKLALTGQPFQASGTYSTEGVALILAASDNLWIGRTSQLEVNTTNRVIRISPIGNIDCLTTNGGYGNPLTLQGVIVAYSQGVGIGTTSMGGYKCNIAGSLNSTSFYQNGTLIDFSSYATNANLTTNYYNKTSTDTLLNAKENTLTFSSPLTRTTNTIGINLSAYSTTGTDTNYLLKTGGTMTGALLNTSSTTSEFKGIQINHATRITHIPYLPDNNIYFRAPLIIDHPDDYLSFGSRLGDNIIRLYGTNFGFGINGATLRYNVPVGSVHRFYHGTTNTAWIDDTGRLKATTFEGSGASLTNVPYTALSGTVPFYTKSENDTLLNAKQATLTGTTTLLGTGGSITALDYNKITTNPLSFTAPLSKSGTNVISIDLSSYALNTTLTTAQTNNSNYTRDASNVLQTNINTTNTNLSTNYYNKSSTDTLLNAKEQILTFSSPLTRSTNTIGINLSAYSTSGTDAAYVLKTGSTMTGTLNGTTINASTALQEAGTNLVSKYLTLSGGTLTGNLTGTNITGTKVNCADATGVNAACLGRLLNVVGVNALMRIWRNDGTNSPAMEFMSGPTTSGTSYTKLWDMGIGGSTATNFFYIRDRKPPSTSLNRLIIDDSGNIGIGTTTNASYRLNVEGSLNTTSINATGNVGIGNPTPLGSLSIGRPDVVDNDGTLVISKRGGGNRNFKFGYDTSFNFCMGDFGGNPSANTWVSTQFNINWSSGNVGIGAINQSQKLYVNGNASIIGDLATNANLSVGTTIFANGDKLNFPNTLNQYKINLWATNVYGFGITGGTLMYSSAQYHRFYNSGNNVNTVQFDDVGNVNMIGALSVGTTASIGGATNIGGLLRHRQSFNYGETVSYEIGYNGSPGLDGWWWTTNGFWAGYGTASYLTIAVNATGVSAVWYGRAYLAGTGGAYAVVQDFRQPDNNNLNQITVTNQWGANGANAMRITILNGAYGGSFIIKVSG
jgi:hypothetical protein